MGLFLLLLLGFGALAVDFAYMYYVKNELQVAADAAALAGAGAIGSTGDTVQTAAKAKAVEFAAKNLAGGDPAVANVVTVGLWNGTAYVQGVTPVNAVYVWTTKTVGIFFGRVFGFARLTATAEAVAVASLPLAPFPLCIPQCGTLTPLVVNPPNLTPGLRFVFKGDTGPFTGWTSYEINSTSMPIARDFILGNRSITNACNICINTTNGIQNPVFCAVRERIQVEKDGGRGSHIIQDGNGTSFNIEGWRTLVPILSNVISTDCLKTKTGCIGDPSYQPGDPFKVIKYADIVITDAIPQGNCPGDSGPVAVGDPGIVIVGTTSGGSIANSIISCDDCGGFPELREGIKSVVWLVN